MNPFSAILDLLRPAPPSDPCHSCPWATTPAEMKDQERALERDFARAKSSHERAALGVVATAGQVMKTESGIQAMLRGVLNEVSRDHGS